MQDLTIRGPVIHLVRTDDGFIGENGLLKPDNTPQRIQPARNFPTSFGSVNVTLEDGQIVYEDRTQPATHPFAFTGITIHIATAPKSLARIRF